MIIIILYLWIVQTHSAYAKRMTIPFLITRFHLFLIQTFLENSVKYNAQSDKSRYVFLSILKKHFIMINLMYYLSFPITELVMAKICWIN